MLKLQVEMRNTYCAELALSIQRGRSSTNSKGESPNLEKMAKEKVAQVNELLQDTGEYGK